MSSNVSKFLSSWCLQGLFYTFTWYDYRAQSSALNFEKKIFSLETDKNDVYLGAASKQNAIFQKICSKKRTHAPNVYLHRAIASSIYKVGTISKILLCD